MLSAAAGKLVGDGADGRTDRLTSELDAYQWICVGGDVRRMDRLEVEIRRDEVRTAGRRTTDRDRPGGVAIYSRVRLRRQIDAAHNVVAGDEEPLAEWQSVGAADSRTPTGLGKEKDQQTGEEGYGERAPGPACGTRIVKMPPMADWELGSSIFFHFLASDADNPILRR